MKKLKERYIKRLENGCWEWIGCKDSAGYGYLRPNKKRISAHRYFYILYNADIPEGMDVCHRCDYPSCVNPEHLWLGTHSDNMKDAYLKGRKNQRSIHNGNYRHGNYIKDIVNYG